MALPTLPNLLGSPVIARSPAGSHYGTVSAQTGNTVTLTGANTTWHWDNGKPIQFHPASYASITLNNVYVLSAVHPKVGAAMAGNRGGSRN